MEDKFRESFEKSPIGTAFSDKKGNLTDANQSTLKIMGYHSLNNILGINIFDDPYVAPKKDKLLEKGHIKIQSPVDFDYIKKTGIYNPTRSGTAFLELNISIIDSGFLVQIQDITERKKVEEKLQKSEECFRAVQENSIDRFTILKPFYNDQGEIIDFIYIYQNPLAAKSTGRRPEELIGIRMTEIWPTFHQTRFFAMYKLVVETGQVREFEEHYNADGVDD